MGPALSKQYQKDLLPGRRTKLSPLERFTYIAYHYWDSVLSYWLQAGKPMIVEKQVFFFLLADSYDLEMALLTRGDLLYERTFNSEACKLEALLNEAWQVWSGNALTSSAQGLGIDSDSGLLQDGVNVAKDQRSQRHRVQTKDGSEDPAKQSHLAGRVDFLQVIAFMIIIQPITLDERLHEMQKVFFSENSSLVVNETMLMVDRTIRAFLHTCFLDVDSLLENIEKTTNSALRFRPTDTLTPYQKIVLHVQHLVQKEFAGAEHDAGGFGIDTDRSRRTMAELTQQANDQRALKGYDDVFMNETRIGMPSNRTGEAPHVHTDAPPTGTTSRAISQSNVLQSEDTRNKKLQSTLLSLDKHLSALGAHVRGTAEALHQLAQNASVCNADLVEPAFLNNFFLGRYRVVKRKRSTFEHSFDLINAYEIFDEVLKKPKNLRLLAVKQNSEEADLYLRNFMREATLLSSKVQHRAMCQIVDHGSCTDYAWQIQDPLVGVTLNEHLNSLRKTGDDPVHMGMSEDTIIRLLLKALEGLRYAHDRGIVHRNLSPKAIFLQREMRNLRGQEQAFDDVKLTEWQLAKWETKKLFGSTISHLESFPDPVGDVRDAFYLCADEFIGDPSKPLPAWDIYSLGCIAFECICLQPPFVGKASRLRAQKEADAFLAHENDDALGADSEAKPLTVTQKRLLRESRFMPKVSPEVFEIPAWMQRVISADDFGERKARAVGLFAKLRKQIVDGPGPMRTRFASGNPEDGADGTKAGDGGDGKRGSAEGESATPKGSKGAADGPGRTSKNAAASKPEQFTAAARSSGNKPSVDFHEVTGGPPRKSEHEDVKKGLRQVSEPKMKKHEKEPVAVPLYDELISEHCNKGVLPPNIRHLLTSTDFVDIVERMLEKSLHLRYQDCSHVKEELLKLQKRLVDLPFPLRESLPHLRTDKGKKLAKSLLKVGKVAKGMAEQLAAEEGLDEAAIGPSKTLDLTKEPLSDFTSRYIAKFARNLICDEIMITGSKIPLYKIRDSHERHINLSGFNLAGSDALIIARASEYSSFESLDVSHNRLALAGMGTEPERVDFTGLTMISEAIIKMSDLRVLDISFNKLGEKGGCIFCSNLPPNLETLKLAFCEIGMDGALCLARAIQGRLAGTLLHCDIAHNNIGDLGCQAICRTLDEADPILASLNLHSNGLGNEAGTSLVTVLETNFSLLHVALSDNPDIPYAHRRLIKRTLSFNCQYKSFKGRNDSFQGFGHQLMAEGLRTWAVGDMFIAQRLYNKLRYPKTQIEKLVAVEIFGTGDRLEPAEALAVLLNRNKTSAAKNVKPGEQPKPDGTGSPNSKSPRVKATAVITALKGGRDGSKPQTPTSSPSPDRVTEGKDDAGDMDSPADAADSTEETQGEESLQNMSPKNGVITSGPTISTTYGGLQTQVYLHTIIGRRKSQEDRFCIAPNLVKNRENCALFGVFDGTVGDFASDTVKDLVVPYLKRSTAFQDLVQNTDKLSVREKMFLLRQSMKSMYSKSDQELLHRCGLNEKHYATCTSVTLLMWEDLICVGHLGDSRVCLIYATNESISKFGSGVVRATRASSSDITADLRSEAEAEGDKDAARQLTGTSENSTKASTVDDGLGSSSKPGSLDSVDKQQRDSDAGTESTKTPGSELETDSGATESQGGQDGGKEDKENSAAVNAGGHSASGVRTAGAVAGASTGVDKGIVAGAIRTDSLPVDKVDELIEGNFVTKDHKPDQAEERSRIEQSGGSVEYLQNHQNKPFIRGGDFQQRKLLGESPMQLQYSRAFGGKDLKPFGLIADPTINVTKQERQFIGFILASDGLWDVVGADQAARVATKAFLRKQNPSEALVQAAVDTSGDNITALCVFYDHMGGDR